MNKLLPFAPSSLLLATTAAISSLSSVAHAQLPPGHLVRSSFAGFSYSGAGGLQFVDPDNGNITPVAGLPCEMTGACTLVPQGCDYVLRRPLTNQLIANAWGEINQPISVWVLDLQGSTVVNSVRYDLATATDPNGYGNSAAAVLADGRILLSMDLPGISSPGPLATELLGILDPNLPPSDPGAITPVPLSTTPAGRTATMTVDHERGLAYLAMQTTVPSIEIYSLPVPAGGTPTLVATVPNWVGAIAVEPDGNLLVSGWNGSNSALARIDVATGTSTSLPSIGASVDAMAIDPISGALYVSGRFNNTSNIYQMSQRSAAGSYSLLTSAPTSGWGFPSGLAIDATINSYGAATGTGTAARWQLAPNPGGAPMVGNTSFSLHSDGGAPGQIALYAIGLTPLQPSIAFGLGIDLWVAPIALQTATVDASGYRLDMPIPADPMLSGFEFFAQGAFFDGTNWNASSGLSVRVR